MRIGLQAIRGESEICVLAIGDAPIGDVLAWEPGRGLLSTIEKRRRFGWREVGAHVLGEPVELETRPGPARRRSTRAGRVVLLVVLVAATALQPLLAVLAEAACAAATQASRWLVAYARREFVSQWRLALCTLAPSIAFLAWAFARSHP